LARVEDGMYLQSLVQAEDLLSSCLDFGEEHLN